MLGDLVRLAEYPRSRAFPCRGRVHPQGRPRVGTERHHVARRIAQQAAHISGMILDSPLT